jgi:hypothetical protein
MKNPAGEILDCLLPKLRFRLGTISSGRGQTQANTIKTCFGGTEEVDLMNFDSAFFSSVY